MSEEEQQAAAAKMVSGWNGIAVNSPEADRLIASFRDSGYEFAYGAAVLISKDFGYVRVVMPDGTYYVGSLWPNTYREAAYLDQVYPLRPQT